jgi:polar amino acid transport system substrate-binding protein
MESTQRIQGTQHEPRRRRRVPLALLLLLATVALLAALALGACGNATDSGGSGGGSTATDTTIKVGPPDAAATSITIKSDPALFAMLPDSVKSSGKMVVASNAPYPPWEYYRSAGSTEFVGIDPDLAQALGAKLGIKLTMAQTKFDAIIPAIMAGKADLVLSAMYDNADRQKVLDFIDYAADGSGILVAAGNPEGITGLDSLSGKVVACQKGTTQNQFLEKTNKDFAAAGKPQINILALPADSDALLAIQSGKAVANMTDGPGGAYIAKTYKGGGVFEQVLDPAFPNGYDPSLIALGMKKNLPDQAKAFQTAMQQLVDDGVWKQILDLYGAGQSLIDPITMNAGK